MGSLANLEDLFKLLYIIIYNYINDYLFKYLFGIVSSVRISKRNILILGRPSLSLGDITINKVKKFWTVYVAIDRSK